MAAYVKHKCFHKDQILRFKPNPFKTENVYYNTDGDYCICLMYRTIEISYRLHGYKQTARELLTYDDGRRL